MKIRRILRPALITAFLLLADTVLAQGCASCYTTAAAGGTQTIHALRNGILVLLVPPALMFTGLMLILRRWQTTPEARQHVPHRNNPVDIENNSQ